VDVTVMPLILGSEYSKFVEIVQGARIAVDGGDRHDGALIHIAMALNNQSPAVLQAGNFLQAMSGKLGVHPFAWIGETVTLYVDDDEVFKEALAAEDPGDFLEENLHRMPLALHVEVQSPMKLAAFLAGTRAFIQQSAPGMAVWETRKHGEIEYVMVTSPKAMEKLTVCYATLPDAFILSLSEDLLKKALDRRAAPPTEAQPWLGHHLCMQADRSLLEVIEGLSEGEFRKHMRKRSWANLPLLNELKRLYPDRDPVELHLKLSGVQLVCPGGGRYAWNDGWKTMESTAFGHPGEPKEGPADVLPFAGFLKGNFGLTFEKEGLRAACELSRVER
jgi:hypothetical protein